MSNKAIIFDFDGTIADTFTSLVDIVNHLASEFDYPPLNQTEVLRLTNLSSREIIKESPVGLHKVPFFLRKIKKELNKKIADLQPFPQIKETLQELKHEGYILGIITSNLESNVVDFLLNNDLNIYFDFLYSTNTLFGKHRTINKVMKKHKLLPENTIYVGDETRDIESAKKSNIKVVAVSWGFNSSHVLENYSPDFMIHSPQELKTILCSQKTAVVTVNSH